MAQFKVNKDSDGVLHLAGELDIASADAFIVEVLADLNGARQTVVDLSELTFIDAAGIRALLRLAAETDDGLVIQRAQPHVARVFEMVRLDNVGGVRIRP
jgi:anti-anti-sigma factor